MPRDNTVTRAIATALRECENRDAAMKRIEALPGMTADRAGTLVDQAMAANRAANRRRGVRMLIGGLVFGAVDAWLLFNAESIFDVHSTRAPMFLILLAMMALVAGGMGIATVSAPSPYHVPNDA